MGDMEIEDDESTTRTTRTREENMVQIVLKTIGPSRPSTLTLPCRIKRAPCDQTSLLGPTSEVVATPQVHDLRKLVADNKQLPIGSLRLISRGSALHDSKNGEDVYINLADGGIGLTLSDSTQSTTLVQTSHLGANVGPPIVTSLHPVHLGSPRWEQPGVDSLIVAIRPKAPPKHVQGGYDEDEDEDDLKFEPPENTSGWKWRLFCFLHDTLKLPDIVLIGIFSLSIKAWCFVILWFILAPVAHKWDLGPLYIIGTGFAIIFLNLGHRKAGELSAYSIFNEDFRELPGTFNAERLDRDLRTGQL